MEKVNEDDSLEFKWLKKRGVGGKKKEVRFYGSFIYDGVEYVLYDCVYMYKEGLQEPYIGKLTKIWENADKAKKVKVHWFFRPEEISKWLGDTKTLENEIFFASGEGVGLANISPLEAIAGKCNVVCVSKDSRNPQPSQDELKAADFIFYRTFDVESCTILDTMDEKIGGIEIKDIFNIREDETTSDKKEENEKANTITCGEPQQHSTKTLIPNNVEDDKKDASQLEETNSKKDEKADKDEKEDACATVTANKMEANKRKKTDNLHDQPSKKLKLDDKNPPKEKQLQLEDSERLTDALSKKSKVDNLHDQSSKKLKLDDKNPPKENQLQLEDSERLTDKPSKKSKVDNSIKPPAVNHVNNVTAGKNSEVGKKTDKDNLKVLSKDKDEAKVSKVSTADKERIKIPVESDKLDDKRPLKKVKSPTNEKQVEEGGDIIEKMTDLPSKKSKVDSKAKENDKGKNADELEGRTIKKTKGEGSFKIPENKKNSTVVNTKGINGKNEGKLKTAADVDAVVGSNNNNNNNNNNNKEDQLNVSKKKLSVSKSSKDMYQEFVITPKPNAERNGWFKRPSWEESLKNAYDQGTAILLHNMDPDYTSSQVEDIIWHAFNEYCEAKILPSTAISTPHSCQALVLLKTKEATHKILAKLDEDCLMLSNGRPLVGTPCPPIIPRKNCKFFGHLVIDRIKITQREEEAVSTSHFSQPNTIEYEMAMDWLLLQSKSKKWWEMVNKVQGTELKKLEAKFVKK